MRHRLFGALLVGLALLGACRMREEQRAFGTSIETVQIDGVRYGRHDVVRWGPDPDVYASWDSHTNRLVPVYTFGTARGGPGVDLDDYRGQRSVYRDQERLTALFGRSPSDTLNPDADYLDQTDLFRIQLRGAELGKRYVFLVVFDGMDWETTRAAAIYRNGGKVYGSGRGYGLHLLDYDASGTTQFGWMVTSPATNRAVTDPDSQLVAVAEDALYGGYDAGRGGSVPWEGGSDPRYVTGPAGDPPRHAYTDSASSATSMCSGIKTYNGAINVDVRGERQVPIARTLQERGYAVGIVTTVPISHATPAAAYANNVSRQDYQDLSRDLLGLPSVTHGDPPLPGVDVLIGCGYGVERSSDPGQGSNFVAGNRYLTDDDLSAVAGRYVVALRTAGVNGAERLAAAAAEAVEQGSGLLGFFGTGGGNLPFRTADGGYDPIDRDAMAPRRYPEAELTENPTLAEMTSAAIEVLAARESGFWLMVEAGDVDWANHRNDIDRSIGSVISGDQAVRVITDWVEANSDWEETLLVVTADHGHYLVLVDPKGLGG